MDRKKTERQIVEDINETVEKYPVKLLNIPCEENWDDVSGSVHNNNNIGLMS